MKIKHKIIFAAVPVLLALTFISCTAQKNPISAVEINTEKDWISFARKYEHQRDNYADSVKVKVGSPLNLTETESIGTAEVPFNGEIDFCDNLITCSWNLVRYGDNVKITNLRVVSVDGGVCGPIVGECSGRVEMENIRVNCAEDNFSGEGMLFSRGILAEQAQTVVLDDIEVFDVGVRHFGSAGGLVSECGKLVAKNVKMDDVGVQSPESSHDGFISCAGLIACRADEVSLTDIEIKNCSAASTNCSSGGVVECKKMIVSNVKYKDCFIETTRKLSTPSNASGLVCRGLEEYSEANPVFEDVILIAENTGYVTADGESEFYR